MKLILKLQILQQVFFFINEHLHHKLKNIYFVDLLNIISIFSKLLSLK